MKIVVVVDLELDVVLKRKWIIGNGYGFLQMEEKDDTGNVPLIMSIIFQIHLNLILIHLI